MKKNIKVIYFMKKNIKIIYMISLSTHIFLIHGIGGSYLSYIFMKPYLLDKGYKNTHIIDYPSDNNSLEESLEFVDKKMSTYANKKKHKIVLFGHSYGGLVSNHLHEYGWNIKLAVYACAPLQCPSYLHFIYKYHPILYSVMENEAFVVLAEMDDEERPPHPYKTISSGTFNTDFDGLIYKHESTLKKKHHTHIKWSDHWTIVYDKRLHDTFYDMLNEA
jgi:pimeloyl-ACP methyl ester carboxylesterase